MTQGKIVEYIDQGSFVSALCLQEQGGRLHLLTVSNREVNLSLKRAVLVSKEGIDVQKPREELLSFLKRKEEIRKKLEKQIQVKDLWELVRDEGESFDYEYLAELCFGADITDDHLSALVRAVFKDKLHFKMKEGRFLPNAEQKVEQMLRQMEEEARKEEIIQQGARWLGEVVRNRGVEAPPFKDEIVKVLNELALYGSDAPSVKFGKELLQRAGITDIGESRRILVNLGIWDEDENLDLIRLEISSTFNEEQQRESAELASAKVTGEGRKDLRDLHVITIDGPMTQDFDDALSLEIHEDSIELGIHIADVASIIPPGGTLDREASQRGSSIYLPRQQIPMIPPSLSQGALSLKEGCDRPAISLLARLDKDGELVDFEFLPSVIRVKQQLTYDQVDEEYRDNVILGEMYRLSELLREKRVEHGALLLSLPEIVFNFDSGSGITLICVDQNTPSKMIVAEMMIFYNWLAARFCKENRIPALFRGQEEPGEKLSVGEQGYIYYVFKQRRKLNPLVIDTEPRAHASLGLDVYTQVTSPIRRYFDLVVQRQIRNFLLGKSLDYDEEALKEKRVMLESLLRDLERLKRNRIRYWILKYLQHHTGEIFSGIILDRLLNRYRVVITDFLMVVETKRQNGQDFLEGQAVKVKVIKSDPWNDSLKIEILAAEQGGSVSRAGQGGTSSGAAQSV